MNVLLMGPRGSGKTTVGRLLAQRWGWPFIDLDERAMRRFPEKSVQEIWRTHGEAAWREAEIAALQEILEETDTVIALGGGAPIIPQASRRIEAARTDGGARLVYLRCPVETLIDRLRRDAGDRPSLTGGDPALETAAVLQRREPVYLSLADIVLDAGAMTPEEAAEALSLRLGRP